MKNKTDKEIIEACAKYHLETKDGEDKCLNCPGKHHTTAKGENYCLLFTAAQLAERRSEGKEETMDYVLMSLSLKELQAFMLENLLDPLYVDLLKVQEMEDG